MVGEAAAYEGDHAHQKATTATPAREPRPWAFIPARSLARHTPSKPRLPPHLPATPHPPPSPADHLDIETIDAVIVALAQFSGGVIIVSHDGHFVESVCDEIWMLGHGR